MRNLLAIKTRELAIEGVGVDLVGQLAIMQPAQLHQDGTAQELLAGGLGGATVPRLGPLAQVLVDPVQHLGCLVQQLVNSRQFGHERILGIDRPDKAFVLQVKQIVIGLFFFAHFTALGRGDGSVNDCNHKTYDIPPPEEVKRTIRRMMLKLLRLDGFRTGTN